MSNIHWKITYFYRCSSVVRGFHFVALVRISRIHRFIVIDRAYKTMALLKVVLELRALRHFRLPAAGLLMVANDCFLSVPMLILVNVRH